MLTAGSSRGSRAPVLTDAGDRAGAAHFSLSIRGRPFVRDRRALCPEGGRRGRCATHLEPVDGGPLAGRLSLGRPRGGGGVLPGSPQDGGRGGRSHAVPGRQRDRHARSLLSPPLRRGAAGQLPGRQLLRVDHARRDPQRARLPAPIPTGAVRTLRSERDELDARAAARRVDDELDAKVLVERFRRDCLPPEWAAVFDARFLRQVTQREAAEELGIRRTTLAYQELRIRRLLTQFLLRAEHP